MRRRGAAALLALAMSVPVAGEVDPATQAKALFFDRKYAEAREVWSGLPPAAAGGAALYWVARCSESLGEHERAFGEYGRYIASKGTDPRLAEEARTSRVGLAMKLYKGGRKEYLRTIAGSLEDRSRTVRYFAALQLSSLGRDVGHPAIPVLQRIVSEERDADLVERAKLALLRLDARALPVVTEKTRPARERGAWIRVRIHEKGESKAQVSVDLPLALAELVFKSLPDETRQELRGRGYESESFLRKLRELGPTQILDVRGDDGERVQIWIE